MSFGPTVGGLQQDRFAGWRCFTDLWARFANATGQVFGKLVAQAGARKRLAPCGGYWQAPEPRAESHLHHGPADQVGELLDTWKSVFQLAADHGP